MASFSGSERSRHTYGVLANVSLVELESIRVGIKRRNINSNQPPGPVERSIDDPKYLVPLVHSKKDHAPKYKSIFDREDIVVNKEERLVLIDANMFDAPQNNRSDSKTRSNSTIRSKSRDRTSTDRSRRPKSRSPERNRRSRSPERNRRSIDRRRRSPDKNRSTDRDRSPDRKRRSAHRSRSPDRDRRSTDRGRSADRKRRSGDRSRSPDRDRSYCSADRNRDWRSRERDTREKTRRYSRERDPIYEKHSVSRRSRSRERYRERYRSLTPLKPGEYRRNHPDLRKRSRSREKYRYDGNRRSGSRTRPSTSKKRSLSPRRSSSRSPKRRKHSDYYEKRRSRSPQPSGSRDRKYYSRSPDYERDKRYKLERGGRSRSPGRKDGVPYRDPAMDFGYYEGVGDYWMHPGLIRPPPYQVQRFYPPAFYPRIVTGGPVLYPPRHPMMQPIIRQKLPVYNSRSKPVVAQTMDKVTTVDKGDGSKEEGKCTIEEVKNNETEDKEENK
ncbi:serine/arginine repetitive matrix protein 1-like isoform X1 [Diorhabda sublineata]|uniref:serine/arginine repetitive matrix protein 1-like isoform X1 n=2 Tax=Diorhabda sublineata TaxID=1163346 RepID=UPI0024E1643B|nr:serine/arginine repetitive matrix protein 1-like isoform X1 [Diorhabda sublineata]